MSAPQYIPIPYLNISGEPVPRFGVLQLTNTVDTAANTTIWSIKVKKPDSTSGVFGIDDGKGAGASGSSAYGQMYIPVSHATWVKFNGAEPDDPWEDQVGPVANQWYMDATGSGYWYAGAFSSGDGLLLVNQVGGSPGTQIVRFTVTAKLGDIPGICTCRVDSVPCGISTVTGEVGQSITVYDFSGCYFNEPSDHLIGRQGWASYMKNLDTGSGTGTLTNQCNWEVMDLCCP